MVLFKGGMIFSTVGILASDYAEKQFPATEDEKLKAEALSPITVVDHADKNSKQ